MGRGRRDDSTLGELWHLRNQAGQAGLKLSVEAIEQGAVDGLILTTVGGVPYPPARPLAKVDRQAIFPTISWSNAELDGRATTGITEHVLSS